LKLKKGKSAVLKRQVQALRDTTLLLHDVGATQNAEYLAAWWVIFGDSS